MSMLPPRPVANPGVMSDPRLYRSPYGGGGKAVGCMFLGCGGAILIPIGGFLIFAFVILQMFSHVSLSGLDSNYSAYSSNVIPYTAPPGGNQVDPQGVMIVLGTNNRQLELVGDARPDGNSVVTSLGNCGPGSSVAATWATTTVTGQRWVTPIINLDLTTKTCTLYVAEIDATGQVQSPFDALPLSKY
jgi:hypothetical protein